MREKLTKRNEQTGFTIIEVVLVLAIAGLIFLIVFLALPQLQRSRRDTQRKSDAGRVMSALESYAGNNNGDYPTASTATGATNFGGPSVAAPNFWASYANIDSSMNDPSTGSSYTTLAVATSPTASGASALAALTEGQVRYIKGFDCLGNAAGRNVAVQIYQETGGLYCQDNK